MDFSIGSHHGFSILRAVVWVAIVGVGLAIGIPNFTRNPASTNSMGSRTKSDMRSLATAIETYFVDHETYPAMAMNPAETMDAQFYKTLPAKAGRTLRATHGTRLESLTTPVAYVTSNFPDPFADTLGIGFRYYTDGRGWMLGSYGPDKDEKTGGQLMWDNGSVDVPPYTPEDALTPRRAAGDEGVERAYNSEFAQPSAYMLMGRGPNGAFTYDPTNGTYSAGDMYRVKQ